jgi:hypothetical protein
MAERLTDRDILLISAYLDGRLSPAENAPVKARIESDPLFQRTYQEMAYTRRLLKALPQKRAPHNFTLSAAQVPASRRVPWLQPALSFVSIAAALLLVVVFSSTFLFGGSRSAAPVALAPQAAEMSVPVEGTPPTMAPAIITWWSPSYGMGGGSDSLGSENYTGGDGIGGAGGPGWDVSDTAIGGGTSEATSEPATMDTLTTPPAEEPLPAETAIPERVMAASPTSTEEPTISALAEEPVPQSIAKGAEAPDLTNLILGLPEEQQRGKILETQPMEQSETSRLPSTRMYIMVASALIAILTGAGAIVVKRH